MSTDRLIDEAEALQNLCISRATGGFEEADQYMRLRQVLLAQPALEQFVPRFIRTCRNLDQFWNFIRAKFDRYAARRTFLWEEFRPLLEALERGPAPSDTHIAAGLEQLDAAHVHAAWSKALDRRSSDPEGAITMARTLLESVCKHILDDAQVGYSDKDDLPALYKAVSRALNLAPSQHTHEVFRQILGGCSAIVEGLGTLRNRLSDAHGKGKLPIRPAARHAELAVNLAGAMSAFLVGTWTARMEPDA